MTELTPLEETPDLLPARLSQMPDPRVPLTLRILEYLCLSALVVQGTIVLVLQQTDRLTPRLSLIFLLSGSISLGVFLVFKLITQEMLRRIHQQQQALRLHDQAALWAAAVPEPQHTAIVAARETALRYCQDLITKYQKTRSIARTLYYSLQLSIVFLSSLTPIFVLLNKLRPTESGWEWLPVVFPALVAIVASISIAFPLQTTGMTAQEKVERLITEQEHFILGITPAYAYPLKTAATVESKPREVVQETVQEVAQEAAQAKAQQAIDRFIQTVNRIHVQRLPLDP